MVNINKRGNIEVIFLVVIFLIFIVILMIIYFLYMQINIQIFPLKQDIFFIVQNAYFSINMEELAYNNYLVDEVILKNKIQNLISINYNNVFIEKLSYDKYVNKVKINLKVDIYPIILEKFIGKFSVNIYDEVKLKTMDVS